jgi:hypothetical protein
MSLRSYREATLENKMSINSHQTFFLCFADRADGIAMNTKVISGAIVQTVSSICPSRMNRLVCLFWIILIIV